MQVRRRFNKFIINWKEYFKDKQKLTLMILLLLFLPVPSIYIDIIGIAPAIYSFIFAFYLMEGLAGRLDTLLGLLVLSGLALLHIIGYLYLYRLIIFLFYKLVNLFTKNKYVIWVLIFIIFIVLVWASFQEIYWYADASGGLQRSNLYSFIGWFA